MTATATSDAALVEAILGVFGARPERLERPTQGATATAWNLRVEFRRDARPLHVVVSTSDGQEQALARGSLLSIGYRGPADPLDIEWLNAAQAALSGPEAAVLAQVAEGCVASDTATATDPWEERPGEPLPAAEQYLEPLLAAHAAHFGARPQPLFHKQLTGAICLRYPQVKTHNQFFPEPGPHAQRPGVIRDYLQALGYATGADGRIRTVPTPTSFPRFCDQHGVDPAFAPKLFSHPGIRFQRLHWLTLLAGGVTPINYADERLYRWFHLARVAKLNRTYVVEDALVSHLGALGHDMSTHVLALHRIPRNHVQDICSRVRLALPKQRDAWRFSVAPITDFFEEDLTLECWKIWRQISAPAEFEAQFDARSAAILELLDARIASARSHFGWKNWWT